MDNKFGTFYGGIANESINTLSLDNQENLIIAGETNKRGNCYLRCISIC
jgi:hypothetical protein